MLDHLGRVANRLDHCGNCGRPCFAVEAPLASLNRATSVMRLFIEALSRKNEFLGPPEYGRSSNFLQAGSQTLRA
jgi:hypothetical protein